MARDLELFLEPCGLPIGYTTEDNSKRPSCHMRSRWTSDQPYGCVLTPTPLEIKVSSLCGCYKNKTGVGTE